jgi:hypothetical protein
MGKTLHFVQNDMDIISEELNQARHMALQHVSRFLSHSSAGGYPEALATLGL